MNNKFFSILLIMTLVTSPAFAKINGGISTKYFYDFEKTIMPEITPDTTIKTQKYWDTNIFHMNKYRPIFMLSNKELYKMLPERKAPIIPLLSVPSVYNVSFKNSSVKKIALDKNEVYSTPIKTAHVSSKADLQSISLYENAKNSQNDSEQKINTAMLLKETKNLSNYALAVDLLNDVTNKEPYNAYAYYMKGELYSLQDDSQNAMKNYVEALRINPYSKQSCLGIAKILEPTNKTLAQKYYDKAK